MTNPHRLLVALALGAAATDLATKALAGATLDDRAITPPGPLTLRLVHNPGVAFGLGTNTPTWAVLTLTATLTLAIAAWRGALGDAGPVGLLLGGATANLLDRLEAGTVVDLFDLGWWPAFNLADTFITIGAALLLLRSLTTTEPAAQPLNPDATPSRQPRHTKPGPTLHLGPARSHRPPGDRPSTSTDP